MALMDRKQLKLQPLATRIHDLDLSVISAIQYMDPAAIDQRFFSIAQHMIDAKSRNRAIILMIGAHVLRSGVQHYLIDLMERGYLSCIAMNGAGIIHDYEFALIGQTTESVARYITRGEFGLWKETGEINDIINQAYAKDPKIGMGKAVGDAILAGDFAHSEVSVLAAASRLGIPVTIHVGIGYDIIHEHPNCCGAATGATSYNDFLSFAHQIQSLEGGVVMNFGSAIMAPEVYLKALSMARNIAHQQGKDIYRFATLVCDLHDLPSNFHEEPQKTTAGYYFRPWKTMLIRTVKDGGESYYVKGRHAQTIPALYTAIHELENR